MTQHRIEHQVERNRFLVATENGDARLEYQLRRGDGSEPGTINFTYTYVPPQLRGRGLAESLVRTGLAWAREEQLQIQASCWYVQKFLN